MSDEQGADACECKFAVAECDIEQVVVYADRAEVTRRVDLDPATTGAADLCRVLITGVSSRMDADSVRVKGTGPATILEVGTDVSFDADDVDTAGTARERTKLDSELKAKRKARAAVEAALARSRVERELLVKYAETSASQPLAGPSTTSAAATAPIDPSSMQKVLEFYAARAASIDETSAQLSEQKADLDGEIRALEQQLGRLRAPPKRRSQTVRVRLALDTPPPGGPAKPAPPAPVCLRVTYMVQGASWEPSYDARADLEGGGRALGLQLSYYGMVTNCTGEDWKDTRLALSTAQPATGGQPPRLPTMVLGWKSKPMPLPRAQRGGRALLSMRSAPTDRCQSEMPAQACMEGPPGGVAGFSNACLMGDEEDEAEGALPPPPPAPIAEARSAVADGSGHAGAARFEIAHQTSVLSDGAAHKVTVGIAELQPTVHHFAAPALEARAYLQARVANTSQYPLLKSANCSVFVDGSFICKSSMPHTMPGETFVLFLGPDPSLKVECRPAITRDATHGEGGLFRTATRTSVTERAVVLTNTRAGRPARVHVAMCLPRASDDKIKVVPLEPPTGEIRHSDVAGAAVDTQAGDGASGSQQRDTPSGGGTGAAVIAIVQNRVTNNLVWMLELQPSAKHTIAFKYKVERPAEREVETTEVFPAAQQA